ncbi:hypothetical protein EDC96DRAFT_494145 [Choanephora cucurbitarum]|nr:hypothetical protein EDC96DRAFT_494145 [Choanephora cucurbitarum]
MSEISSFLFWIEQEPVESEKELFLPPDTPVHRPSTKVLHQIQKIKQKRLVREAKRLKTAYYECLKARRRERAAHIDKSRLPTVTSTPNKIDFVSGTDFINRNEKQIVELLELARSMKSNTPSITTEQMKRDKEKEKTQEKEAADKLAYQKQIEDEWVSEIKGMEAEYNTLNSKLFKEEPQPNKQSAEQEDQTLFHISNIAPLPPRVSHKDPRTFLPEYRTRF